MEVCCCEIQFLMQFQYKESSEKKTFSQIRVALDFYRIKSRIIQIIIASTNKFNVENYQFYPWLDYKKDNFHFLKFSAVHFPTRNSHLPPKTPFQQQSPCPLANDIFYNWKTSNELLLRAIGHIIYFGRNRRQMAILELCSSGKFGVYGRPPLMVSLLLNRIQLKDYFQKQL